MKIGIVCYPTFGGSGVVATELGKALAHKGHQVHFITYRQPFKLDYFTENLFYHEVSISDYALFDYPPYELSLTNKLVDVVRFEKLDLLHVHYAIPHASAAYLAKQILASHDIQIPYITTLHGTDITLIGKDPSYNAVIAFAINQSDAVTAVSKSLKEDTLKLFEIEKEIRVIPNFVCLDTYSPTKVPSTREVPTHDKSLRQLYAPNDEKIIIHVSNFRKVKRVEDIIWIFEKVRKEIPSRLILIGDGPERHNIETLCRKLNTCDDIKLLGKLKATEKILSISDLFLLPSETESFGLAALEAMASHVPVISTNTGGLPEVNIHGVTGFLSNVGDIDDMAKNAIHILGDESRLNEFKANAHKQAEKFDIKKVLPLYEALYDEISGH